MLDYHRDVFTIEHNGRLASVRWDIGENSERMYLYITYRGKHRQSRFDKDREDCEVETWVHRQCDDIDRYLSGADIQ